MRSCLRQVSASAVMMASTAARCSTRWTTVIVSCGRHGAARTLIYAGHGGTRSISTLGAERLWLGTSVPFRGAAKALTLRGLSGECCALVLACAKLTQAKVVVANSDLIK